MRLRVSGDRATAADQTRQEAEADATGDHRGSTEQQERGLGRTGLGELVLALALLDRLVADTVRVGVVVGVRVDGVRRPGGSAVGTAIGPTVGTTIGATVSTTIGTTIGTAVGATVSAAIGTAVGTTIGATVSTAVGTTIGATVSTTIGATVGTAVSAAIGATIGATVSTTIGATVSTTIGTAIGATVSAAIGATVGTAIGTADEAADEAAVGPTVGPTIGSAVSAAVGTAVDTTDAALAAAVDAAGLTEGDLGRDSGLFGVHTDVDDARGLGRTGGRERGTCGDNRTSGYTRDADSRLLRHLLLPPVADLVHGAALCGPRPCGVTFSAGPRRTWSSRPPPITPVPDIRVLL
ncbi:hypothetical protein SAMN05421860_10140 [Streptomyces microflavus]|nr:hypothetical protein SAMN05421860_10140 [Streptomyces microflavus]